MIEFFQMASRRCCAGAGQAGLTTGYRTNITVTSMLGSRESSCPLAIFSVALSSKSHNVKVNK